MIWAPAALRDIDLIYQYIVAFNPSAAVHLAERLLQSGDSLCEFPERGRPARHGRRELLVVWPYIIRYRIQQNQVTILRVRHGRRRSIP